MAAIAVVVTLYGGVYGSIDDWWELSLKKHLSSREKQKNKNNCFLFKIVSWKAIHSLVDNIVYKCVKVENEIDFLKGKMNVEFSKRINKYMIDLSSTWSLLTRK